MSEWISVKNQLPQYGDWSVVLADNKVMPAYRAHTDRSGEHFKGYYDPSRDSTEIYGVTHWMPLPSHQKQVSDALLKAGRVLAAIDMPKEGA